MACRIVQVGVDGEGHPVSAIVCSHKQPQKKCRFCAARDVKTLCDWPVVKLVSIFASDLKVGDRFHFDRVHRPDRAHLVEAIDLSPGVMEVKFHVPGLPPQPPLQFRLGVGRIYLEKPGTCDAPCCYRHRRHVGPDKDYCADHWSMEL